MSRCYREDKMLAMNDSFVWINDENNFFVIFLQDQLFNTCE